MADLIKLNVLIVIFAFFGLAACDNVQFTSTGSGSAQKSGITQIGMDEEGNLFEHIEDGVSSDDDSDSDSEDSADEEGSSDDDSDSDSDSSDDN